MKIDINKVNSQEFKASLEVLKILSEHGEAYLVGGSVRDILLGNKPKDFDVATNVSMDTICGLFNTHDIGKNKDFGIVVVKHRNFLIEVANFREDGAYLDNRRPSSVKLGVTFEEDTKRRDFTFNSLGMDLQGNVVDYHNGLKDLNNKILRTVGNAQDRFNEDALRILRAVRFAVRFDLKLDDSVVDSIHELKDSLKNISVERIKDELMKMTSYGSRKLGNALKLMNDLGLSKVIFGFNVNDYAISKLKEANNYDFVVCSSILFLCNIDESYAKIWGNTNFSIDNTGEGQVDYRESVERFMDKLKYTNEEKKEALFIVGNFDDFKRLHDISKKKALKLVLNPFFKKLSYVCMIVAGKSYPKELMDNILKFDVINSKKKLINETLLKENVAGRIFGQLSEAVVDWLFEVMEAKGTLPDDKSIEDYVRLICLTKKN
jgi:tRNA nucleotidyltransferase (CCA-adding enzyme)